VNLVNTCLRRPLTVLVLVLAVGLTGFMALERMSRDIFPPLGIPTIYVAQPFGGMDPAQMEGYLTYYYEYHFLYITGIEHIESKSIQGASIMKLQFHPGTDMASAMSETIGYVNRARAFMPAGTVPPFVMRFDAGSVAVGYLVFDTDNPERTLGQMQDAALNQVRPLFATLPGVSAPPPFGGSARSILVNVDPERMSAYGLSPDEIVRAITQSNVISPSGNMNLGDRYPIVPVNAVVRNIKDLESVALRTREQGSVFVRDVARVEDSSDIVTSYALVNGRRTVYLPVTKRSDASTLAVVQAVRDNIPRFQSVLPEDITVSYEFDQSPVVTSAISNLVTEGALGALLSGLMVLFFLRSWRSAAIVVVTIPLALLASAAALWLSGQTIHLMTLGGLALAVGILVDMGTVAIENTHTHMAQGKSPARAAAEAVRETAGPLLVAMLCILAVFIPAFFMTGAARALFVPLALSVGFAMIAAFVLSATLVPILAAWGLKHEGHHENVDPAPRFGRWVGASVRARVVVVGAYLAGTLALVALVGSNLGYEIFPANDTGQFALRFRAASGTRLAETERYANEVLAIIAREAGGTDNVDMSIGMVGVHSSNYPVNLIHLWNSGPEEGWLAVQLNRDSDLRVADFTERLREVFARELPELRVSFEPSDIVSKVMSFGASTPIEVAVSGPDFAATRVHAEKIREKLATLPQLRDVQIAQTLDFPTVSVNVDRERAGTLGVTVGDVTRSLVAATTSSRFTAANLWADPNSGVSYIVQVQIPQTETNSLDDIMNVPVTSSSGKPVLLRNVAEVQAGTAVGTYERYNMNRVVSVTANIFDGDIGRVRGAVQNALDELGPPADARTTVDIRGQWVPLSQLIDGFRSGLLITVVVILLVLTAVFQSFRLALAVVSTLPAVLASIALTLWLTGTTLNIQSAMGAIMAIGVAVANAILLVTFAEQARQKGESRIDAAITGARTRLRPILMTSFAMIAGMLPLALGLGEGGDQTAPLGRAVAGGLAGATLATLLVLPAVFALIAPRGTRSPSLDPDDSDSRFYESVQR
jgi:multidrug efflux pump subunit AcrB